MECVDILINAISNFGFPIACVVAMFYMWNKEREEHAAESQKWVDAINNNTNVMNRILEAVKKD